MSLSTAYLGSSGLRTIHGASVLTFEPNLERDPVAFDAPLKQPVRFREAMSALHDVVVSDLRFKPRDKTAYEEWKKGEQQRLAALREAEYGRLRKELDAKSRKPIPETLEMDYRRCLKRYWTARRGYNSYLRKRDPALWRMIMPYDPVITVADDVVFFECFSGDESSYGCLSVCRDDGFGRPAAVQPGTTNVDYSWELYNHFQSLRSYRETRFQIDPRGFEVATGGNGDIREEKIDLPAGWLRGFMQLQSAMGMRATKVTLSREAVYSLLAWLKRRKARQSPRAIRFELLPGKAPRLVLEPWEKEIVSHSTKYDGPSTEPIRIWGRRRLLALARTLPLVDGVDVYLLGTGLPSFWVARMGEMTLTLGLSGWTANDWTRGSALDLLAPPVEVSSQWIEVTQRFLKSKRKATLDEINGRLSCGIAGTEATLRHLAHTGQVIHDLSSGVFRRRQIMPMIVGEEELGPPDKELTAARTFVGERKVVVRSRETLPSRIVALTGETGGTPVEVLIDADGRIKRGKCECRHHHKMGIRGGPCRHILALRMVYARKDFNRGQRPRD